MKYDSFNFDCFADFRGHWYAGFIGSKKSKFQSYSKIPLANGMTGREVATKMLRDNGIYDVKVTSVNGFLSDHYNPVNKTVNLSTEVYNGNNIASAAVAAHECGHAVQHAGSYQWLMMRSRWSS